MSCSTMFVSLGCYRLFSLSSLSSSYEQLNKFPDNSPKTQLVVDLKDTDPDDAFSSIPYEKGSCFLYYLEKILGGPG